MMTLHEITVEQMQRLYPVDHTVVLFAAQCEPLIVAMWENEPTSFIGLIPVHEGAYIWMQTLPATDKHKIATARHAKDLIKRALERYPKIIGHCKDSSSVRWMQSLGAKFVDVNPPMFEIKR